MDYGLLYARGSASENIADDELAAGLVEALGRLGPRRRVLALPPDGTRRHARAGVLLSAAYRYYGGALAAVMPALGTHRSMGRDEATALYPDTPWELFRAHDWTRDVVELGRVPAEFVYAASGGACAFDWPAQVNRLVAEGGFDLVLSIGQVVPHEVAGMSNYSKNLFIGTGGREAIDRSHWLGAASGIENVMGRTDNPVRAVLDYAQEHFAAKLPVVYALTVVGQDAGADGTRGLYVGGREAFLRAAALSADVNVHRLDRAARTVVVWLDPDEYRSTWLGNKAIYRTRMAVAAGGRVVVLAPGVDRFGEDPRIDATIRRYGYRGFEAIRGLVDSGALAGDLAGAAHLVHGSTEGRFSVTYAAGGLSRAEIEGVGYERDDVGALMARFDPRVLRNGWHGSGSDEFYYVGNPGAGLWTAPR